MNYIVFDLEFNQGYKYRRKSKRKKRDLTNPKCPFEVIQIGVIKLDENLENVSEMNALVKPSIYKNIHPFISDMTGITTDELNGAKVFKEVFKDFVNLLDEDSVLCPWGVGDIRELVKNINYHKLDRSLIPSLYIDIQRETSNHLSTPKGNCIGLENAAKSLDIPIESDFHDAFNDAYYTAEIFKKIYNNNIKTNTYNLVENSGGTSNKNEATKTRLDTDSFIKQVEKMFGKELTKREISLIKVAYMMGKTKQFQIKVEDTD